MRSEVHGRLVLDGSSIARLIAVVVAFLRDVHFQENESPPYYPRREQAEKTLKMFQTARRMTHCPHVHKGDQKIAEHRCA